MRAISDLKDLLVAFNQLSNIVDNLNTRDWNRHQMRLVNNAPSKDSHDYIIQKELTEAVLKLEKAIADFKELMAFELNKKADKTVQTGVTGGHTHTQM